MGSTSDWDTMKESCDVLDELNISYEKRVVSAHRTPEWMAAYATQAEDRGLQIIIAGAGGAAHLPGMVAAQTLLPVLGVPVKTSALAVRILCCQLCRCPAEFRLLPWPLEEQVRTMLDYLPHKFLQIKIRNYADV